MIVYHGSDSNFKTLRISKSLVKHKSTFDNEGLGIYFSTNIETAKSYGKYLYILEINDNVFMDFRKLAICKSYLGNIVSYVYQNSCINIMNYITVFDTINRLNLGALAVSGVGKELSMLLDSTEKWYTLPESKINKVYKLLKSIDKNCPKAYMFNYHIVNIGVIKDVSPDVVRIVDKLRR